MGIFRFLLSLLKTKPPAQSKRYHYSPTSAVNRRESIVVLDRHAAKRSPGQILKGQCWVVDGDTIVINKVHIRLAGIDAPELDHPYGQKAKWALVELCKGQTITAHIKPEISYDRLVAQCFLPDGRDIGAELVKQGMALDWTKFSGGLYKHLETTDARKRLWRAAARQQGWTPPRLPE